MKNTVEDKFPGFDHPVEHLSKFIAAGNMPIPEKIIAIFLNIVNMKVMVSNYYKPNDISIR